MGLDQVAVMSVKAPYALINEQVARFFVTGITRQGTVGLETNHFRPFDPEDNKWITVEQSRSGWGIFEVSTDNVTDGGTWTFMNPFVLKPTDKVVRLIGEDFRVIDPRTEPANGAKSPSNKFKPDCKAYATSA